MGDMSVVESVVQKLGRFVTVELENASSYGVGASLQADRTYLLSTTSIAADVTFNIAHDADPPEGLVRDRRHRVAIYLDGALLSDTAWAVFQQPDPIWPDERVWVVSARTPDFPIIITTDLGKPPEEVLLVSSTSVPQNFFLDRS